MLKHDLEMTKRNKRVLYFGNYFSTQKISFPCILRKHKSTHCVRKYPRCGENVVPSYFPLQYYLGLITLQVFIGPFWNERCMIFFYML